MQYVRTLYIPRAKLNKFDLLLALKLVRLNPAALPGRHKWNKQYHIGESDIERCFWAYFQTSHKRESGGAGFCPHWLGTTTTTSSEREKKKRKKKKKAIIKPNSTVGLEPTPYQLWVHMYVWQDYLQDKTSQIFIVKFMYCQIAGILC